MSERGLILIKNRLKFCPKRLDFVRKCPRFCPRIIEHCVQYLLKKSASIPCCACFHELFSKNHHFVQNSDKFRGILSENVRNFVRDCFFRTKLGQKFVKFAQEALECQMNIVGWFSDKWIFRWLDFLCVYAFLIFKRG